MDVKCEERSSSKKNPFKIQRLVPLPKCEERIQCYCKACWSEERAIYNRRYFETLDRMIRCWYKEEQLLAKIRRNYNVRQILMIENKRIYDIRMNQISFLDVDRAKTLYELKRAAKEFCKTNNENICLKIGRF